MEEDRESLEKEIIDVDLDGTGEDMLMNRQNQRKSSIMSVGDNYVVINKRGSIFNQIINLRGIQLAIKQKKSRIFYLIIFGLSIVIGAVSVVFYMKEDESTTYILYFLEWHENDDKYIPFRTTSNSLFVILSLILISIITSMVMIIKGKFNQIELYLKDTNPYLPICLITMMVSFLIGVAVPFRAIWTILINLGLCIAGTILTGIIILKVSRRKFDEGIIIINECFLPSILFALLLYGVLFNLTDFITRSYGGAYNKNNFAYSFDIGCNFIYFISGELFLILFKDIVYPSVVVIIETGLVSNKEYYFSEILTPIAFVVLTFFTVIWTVLKLKYKVFRMNQEQITIF